MEINLNIIEYATMDIYLNMELIELELNKKILRFGFIGVGIILVISMVLVFSLKLDNPVFLKTYIEDDFAFSNTMDNGEIHQDIMFPITYIKNTSDKRQIQRVEFPNHKDIQFRVNRDGWFWNRKETKGIYEVKTVTIELYTNTLPEEFDKLEFSKAKVIFNNGDTLDADLGRFILYRKNIDGKYIEHGSSGSSSDGTSQYRGTVMRDITLEKLESDLFQETKGLYEIEIDGEDYRDISGKSYKLGDKIKVQALFKTPEDITKRYNHYDIKPKLIFKTSDGEAYMSIYNIDYRPHEFKFLEIIKYLKARGEI